MSKGMSATEFRLDIKAGTKVRISTVFDEVFEGFVQTNPIDTEVGYCITLVQCYPVTTEKKFVSLRRFFMNEIVEVRILGPPPVEDLSRVHQEVSVRVVDDKDEFFATMRVVMKLESVAFNVFSGELGSDPSRFISYLCFFAKGVLIVVDFVELVSLNHQIPYETFWGEIGAFLQSVKVQKVFEDTDYIREALKHKNFALKHFDDVKIMDQCLREYGGKAPNVAKDPCNLRPLSALLEEYLPRRVNLEELKLLKKWEQKDSMMSDHYMYRPVFIAEPNKVLVIRMKYIVELRNKMISIEYKAISNLNNFNLKAKAGTLDALNWRTDRDVSVNGVLKKAIIDAVV